MARPESPLEQDPSPTSAALIALARLLARQAAAEALNASEAEGASETPFPKEAEQ